MDKRSILGQCFHRIKDGRQYLIFNLDELQRLVNRFLIDRRDGRDLITDEAHLVDAENILVPSGRADAIFLARDIFMGDNRFHTRKPFCFRRIDMQNLRVGMRARQDLADEHVRKLEITGISGLAGSFHPSIYLWNTMADHSIIFFHATPLTSFSEFSAAANTALTMLT